MSDLYIAGVLSRFESFKRTGLIRAEPRVRPRAWLENFEEHEQFAAAALLDTFVYYSDEMTSKLLRASYTNLLDEARGLGAEAAVRSAYVAPIEGEDPNVSDSGNMFCRKARYELGIHEDRLLPTGEALEAALGGASVILIDDFMGSGEQLVKTWKRRYRSTSPRSFEEAASQCDVDVTALLLVSTEDGYKRARFECLGLRVLAGHVLGEDYSVRRITELPQIPDDADHPDLQNEIHQLLARVAPELVLKEYMRRSDFALYGFQSFGLSVAFQHGTPDAMLPVFWAEGPPDWTPLVRPA